MNDLVVNVSRRGNKYVCTDPITGGDFSAEISYAAKRKAFTGGKSLKRTPTKNGKTRWVTVEPMSKISSTDSLSNTSQSDVISYIHSSYALKPKGLVLSELKWKYLVRSAIRGRNIMLTGYSGCGKTLAAKSLVSALDRPDFYFNLGSTQDPRASLIGNTHFDKNTGTYFSESLFVKAIQTPNAVILMDEISRAHPEAWNILMTVLDRNQRYLRLDEADGSPTIRVASGVSFIATANIGTEFTSTRVMDRALMDRFVVVEMEFLDAKQEADLLTFLYPTVEKKKITATAEIADQTRSEFTNDGGKLNNVISTRMSVEVASLLYDGFKLEEAAEVALYPFFDDSEADGERTFVKQLVQKYIEDEEAPEKIYEDQEAEDESKPDDDTNGDKLFTDGEIKQALS